MLNARGTAADHRTEPKILFGSRPVEPNIRMDFRKDAPLFSTLAPGRGAFPSKFQKFGLQNLPNNHDTLSFGPLCLGGTATKKTTGQVAAASESIAHAIRGCVPALRG